MGNCIFTRSEIRALREWQEAVQKTVTQQSLRLRHLEDTIIALSKTANEKHLRLESAFLELESQLKDQVSEIQHEQCKVNRRLKVVSSKMESEIYLANALRGVIHRLNKFCSSCLRRVELFSRRLQQLEGNLNSKKKKPSSTYTAERFNKKSLGVLETLIKGLCESEVENSRVMMFAEEILQGIQNSPSFLPKENSEGRSGYDVRKKQKLF